DDHCDCMMPINTYRIDFSDIGALIAPRPFLIAQTTGDGYYSIEAVRMLYDKIKPIYSLYKQSDHLSMVEAAGGHSYGANEEFRRQILVFFLDNLMGRKIDPRDSITIDLTKKWTDADLAAYTDGVPVTDITREIQESFVQLAQPTPLKSIGELKNLRKEVKDFLEKKTFNAFPEESPAFDLKLEFKATDFAPYGTEVYSFISEEGWRLKITFRRNLPPGKRSPLLLILRNPNEERWDAYSLAAGSREKTNVAYLDVRGVGETGWDPALQWHIRRASAWTGQTIASMRVYDVLRCLEMVRKMDFVDPLQIFLAAQGELAAIAPYAAVLDANVKGLILKNPPATQNTASDPSGKGEAIEMLNCLQVTDLPQVAGFMFPKELIMLGEIPKSYEWTKNLYETLDHSSAYHIMENLDSWNPN
ncbi:MAG: hypothetical protein KDC53_25455, partial [Saprospiraceae bacterium]|nr:hypothetical protein [Saprospiraceae bacterium]